jgi:hypothetical protein
MPLILESPDGRIRLEFAIIGYQFPHIEGRKDDSNWLIIRISARGGDLTWSAEDPALLTWDVERLARTLDDVASGCSGHTEVGFLEPCLEVHADPRDDGRVRLRVLFGYELYPPGRLGPGARDSDVYLDFDLTSEQLHAVATQLREELSRFPARPWQQPGRR